MTQTAANTHKDMDWFHDTHMTRTGTNTHIWQGLVQTHTYGRDWYKQTHTWLTTYAQNGLHGDIQARNCQAAGWKQDLPQAPKLALHRK